MAESDSLAQIPAICTQDLWLVGGIIEGMWARAWDDCQGKGFKRSGLPDLSVGEVEGSGAYQISMRVLDGALFRFGCVCFALSIRNDRLLEVVSSSSPT